VPRKPERNRSETHENGPMPDILMWPPQRIAARRIAADTETICWILCCKPGKKVPGPAAPGHCRAAWCKRAGEVTQPGQQQFWTLNSSATAAAGFASAASSRICTSTAMTPPPQTDLTRTDAVHLELLPRIFSAASNCRKVHCRFFPPRPACGGCAGRATARPTPSPALPADGSWSFT